MLDYLRADESREVLIIVVLPLLLLFAAGILLWIRKEPLLIAKFPKFSVRLVRTGKDDVYIVYEQNAKRIEFYAGAGSQREVQLQAPKDLPAETIHEVLPNLAMGLAKLRFRQYTIRRDGDASVIAKGP